MPKYFILSYYYHICLPQLNWNSSARCKHTPGRRGIVCAQAKPNWVAVGPVSTPLLRIFGLNTAGGSLARFNQKRPTTTVSPIINPTSNSNPSTRGRLKKQARSRIVGSSTKGKTVCGKRIGDDYLELLGKCRLVSKDDGSSSYSMVEDVYQPCQSQQVA